MAYKVQATVGSNDTKYDIYFYYNIVANSYTSGYGKSTVYFDFIVEETGNYEFSSSAFEGHSLNVNGTNYAFKTAGTTSDSNYGINTNDDDTECQYSFFTNKVVNTSSSSYTFPKSCTVTHKADGSASFIVYLNGGSNIYYITASANGYGPGKVTLNKTTVTSGFSTLPYKGKLTINYYSNYANKSFSNPNNAVSATKNVIVKTAEFLYDTEYSDGLHNYSSSTSGTYLGRTGYKATGFWGTSTSSKTDDSTSVWENDSFATGAKLAQHLGKNISGADATVNLYPIWQPYKLTVTYNCNGATSITYKGVAQDVSLYTVSDQFEYGTVYTSGLSNGNNSSYLYCTKTGYHFKEYSYITNSSGTTAFSGCWNTKPDGSGISVKWNPDYSEKSQYDGQFLAQKFGLDLSDGDKSITVYAEWEPNTYTLIYDYNGGSGTMSNTSCTYDTGTNLPKNEFIRTGYTLRSWNTQADGLGVDYQPETSIINLTTQDNDSITLYAIWRANILTVNFYANGATNIVTNGESKVLTNDLLTTMKYNYTDDNSEATILPYYNKTRNSYIQRPGYHYYNNTGVWCYEINNVKLNVVNWGQTMGLRQFFSSVRKLEELEQKDCEINLYCLWEPNKLTIKYVGNNNTEYTIDGTTHNAVYSEQITYDYSDTNTITINSLDDIQRIGYDNKREWGNTEDGSIYIPYGYESTVHNICNFFGLLNTIATGNCSITLYNLWDPIDYIVTFDPNGGTGTMDSQIFIFDEPQKLNANTFTRSGYMFVGWSIYKDVSAENYDFNNEQQIEMSYFSVDGSTTQQTLYAIWKAENVNIINKMYVKHTDGNWYGGYLYAKNEQGKWYTAENIHINQNGIWTPGS